MMANSGKVDEETTEGDLFVFFKCIKTREQM